MDWAVYALETEQLRGGPRGLSKTDIGFQQPHESDGPTVRVWKKRLEHQAHSRFEHRDGDGLPVTTGDRAVTRPPSPISMLLSRHPRRHCRGSWRSGW